MEKSKQEYKYYITKSGELILKQILYYDQFMNGIKLSENEILEEISQKKWEKLRIQKLISKK